MTAIYSTPVPAIDGDKYYYEGRKMEFSGNLKEAVNKYEMAVSENKNHLIAYYHLGMIYMGNILTLDKAEAAYKKILEISCIPGICPRDDILLLSKAALGRIYITAGKSESAIILLGDMIEKVPAWDLIDEVYNLFGLALYLERRYEDALAVFKRGLEINTANKRLKFNVKMIRNRLHNYSSGVAYSRIGKSENAISRFRKTINLDPRFVDARLRLGMEYLKCRKSEQALYEFKRIKAICPDYSDIHYVWFGMGLALRQQGKSDEALQVLSKCVKKKPDYDQAHNVMGEILFEKGDYQSAIQHFGHAISINNKQEYVLNMLKTVDKMSGP
jgi:tetratricopeptide (TPR) repeat protein